VLGSSGMKKYAAAAVPRDVRDYIQEVCTRPGLPMIIVNNPSRIKIQDHPSNPPTPRISLIPRANKPPKAPATVAIHK
jgi:hypothetical protein